MIKKCFKHINLLKQYKLNGLKVVDILPNVSKVFGGYTLMKIIQLQQKGQILFLVISFGGRA